MDLASKDGVDPDRCRALLQSVLEEPEKHFGESLVPGHRDALKYVLKGDPRDRQAALKFGRPDLPIGLLPLSFEGYPVAGLVGVDPLASRLLEILLLGNCHLNVRDWMSPLTDTDILRRLEEKSDALALPRAELSAIVISTLPSEGAIAEEWLLRQKDSVFQSALRRVQSDNGLQCLFRYALERVPERFDALIQPVLRKSKVFEGRVANALLSVTDTYAEAVKARWLSLAPSAKLAWGLRFETALNNSGVFAQDIEETIRHALHTPEFFDTPQAGWFAGVALKRYGARFRMAIERGILGSTKPVPLIHGLGRISTEDVNQTVLQEVARILASLQAHFAGDEEVTGALAEARGLLERST